MKNWFWRNRFAKRTTNDPDRRTESQISGIIPIHLLPPLTHHHSAGGSRGEQIGAVLEYVKSTMLDHRAS